MDRYKYSRWMYMDRPLQAQSSIHRYFVRHPGMSSSCSFRWRLCCCDRQWLKSSASCGHLSSVVGRTGATTCHIMSHVSESSRIYQNLSESIRFSESIRIYRQWHYHQHDQNKRTKRTTPTTITKISNNCTTAPIRFHTLRLLLLLHLFLQALLAICGFFCFCYSCLYGVCLDRR